MNFPILQTNNFFDKPFDILEYANTLNFEKDKNGRYPGKRTKSLHILNNSLFNHINSKVIRLLYPEYQVFSNIHWTANTYFQKINYSDVTLNIKNLENKGVGWVHTDRESMITILIYLTPSNINSGTSIYVKKNDLSFDDAEMQYTVKRDFYLNKNVDEKKYLEVLNKNINNYNLLCKSNSIFNSMFLFDSSHFHSANFDLEENEERITLLSFINNITVPYFPIPEMNKI